MDTLASLRLARLLALLAALLLAACGGAPPPATFPTGTFQATIPEEAAGGNELMAPYIGDWQLSVTPEGRYTLVNKGVEIVRGSYAASADQVTFTEESGLFAEPGAQVSYGWRLEQGALRFEAVDDPDPDRTFVMATAPWAPIP